MRLFLNSSIKKKLSQLTKVSVRDGQKMCSSSESRIRREKNGERNWEDRGGGGGRSLMV